MAFQVQCIGNGREACPVDMECRIKGVAAGIGTTGTRRTVHDGRTLLNQWDTRNTVPIPVPAAHIKGRAIGGHAGGSDP